MRGILNLVRRRINRELAAEAESHIQEKAADLVESGMPEEEARHQALREFGNVTRYVEISREAWGWTALERFGQDLRYAVTVIMIVKAATPKCDLAKGLEFDKLTVVTYV